MTLKMDQFGTIELEDNANLHIDNSVVYICEDDELKRWRGILLGKNCSLVIDNESIIKRASRAVFNNEEMFDLDYDFWEEQESSEIGNNSVELDNSTFLDCGLGVVLDGNHNQVSIMESTFKDNGTAVSLRGNRDGALEITESDFSKNGSGVFLLRCGGDNRIVSNHFINESTTQTVYEDIFVFDTERFECAENIHEKSLQGISSINSTALVHNGNQFIEVERAIGSSGTHPTAALSVIGDLSGAANYFDQCDKPIRYSGVFGAGMSAISNNLIEHSYVPVPEGDDASVLGIAVYGENAVDVTNNTIAYLQDGIFVKDAAANENVINCNSIEASRHQDITIKGDNGDLKFLQNDVSSYQSNARIALIDATVLPFQGEEGNPADNCFNVSTVPDLVTSGMTSPFDYFHFTDPCLVPGTGGAYSTIADEETGKNCPDNVIGSNYDPTGTDPGPVVLEPTVDDLQPHMIGPGVDDAVDQIINAGGDDPYTYPVDGGPSSSAGSLGVDGLGIYQGEQLLSYYISESVNYSFNSHDYIFTEQLLSNLKKWKWQKLLCGFYISTDQLQKARNLLASMPQNTADELAFVEL